MRKLPGMHRVSLDRRAARSRLLSCLAAAGAVSAVNAAGVEPPPRGGAAQAAALEAVETREREGVAIASDANDSDLSADEEVVFFPTAAQFDPAEDAWQVPIRGIVFEPERESLWRRALVAEIGRLLALPADGPEAALLNARLRLFLVDHERGERLAVRFGGRSYAAGRSRANGHFGQELRLKRAEAERLRKVQSAADGWLRYEAVAPPTDGRSFVGRVQLVDPRGWSIISDIDDTIKITQVADKREAVRNTLLRPFATVPGMAEFYQACSARGFAFHYVSNSPWQLYEPLADFLETAGYPAGSFDLRHFRLQNPGTIASLWGSYRDHKLAAMGRLLAAYPQRRFVLVGDSGEEDPEIYAAIAERHPGQTAAVLIRNVSGETSDNPRMAVVAERLADVRLVLFEDPAGLAAVIQRLVETAGASPLPTALPPAPSP